MTNKELIAKAREIDSQATPGNWIRRGPYPGVSILKCNDEGEYEPIAVLDQRIKGEPCKQAELDGDFIAESRTLLPKALVRIEKLEAALKLIAVQECDCADPTWEIKMHSELCVRRIAQKALE